MGKILIIIIAATVEIAVVMPFLLKTTMTTTY